MRGIATGGSRGPAGAGVPVGGTSGQILAKNSNTDFDTAWLDASSLPQNPAVAVTKKTFQQRTVLYDNTLSATGLFEVSSLPQDYDHLEVMLAGRSTVNGDFWFNLAINADTDQNNYLTHLEFYGTNSGQSNSLNRNIGYIASNDSPAGQFPVTTVKFPEYSKTDRHKMLHWKSHGERLTAQGYTVEGATVWRNVSAINRIGFAPITGQFAVGSRLQIIGVKEEEVVTNVENAGPEVASGWIAADTLTYASATSFTLGGDKTAVYSPGVKIKLTQTSVKYFYVVGSTFNGVDTTVTITGGSDYTLANSQITAASYSRIESPEGFPGWFTYAPSWLGSGTPPSLGNGTLLGRFCVQGRSVTVNIEMTMGSTTSFGNNEWYWTLPVQTTKGDSVGSAWALDAGVAYRAGVSTNSTVWIYVSSQGGPTMWSNTQPQTWAATDRLKITHIYQI